MPWSLQSTGTQPIERSWDRKEERGSDTMERSAQHRPAMCHVLAGLFFVGTFCTDGALRAQTSKLEQGKAQDPLNARTGRTNPQPGADRRGARAASKRAQEADRVQTERQNEPSVAYRESIRRAVERRRQRRARRQQGVTSQAVGAIVPWPMPPALIIRHTPHVHGDVDALLYGLRR
jgi:hypothetical protein